MSTCSSLDKRDKQYIYIDTPYYRQLIPTHYTGCTDEPDFMYSPYDIFVMESRLYPFIYQLLGNRKSVIFFPGIKEDHRMSIKIILKEVGNVDTQHPYGKEDKIIKLSAKEHKLITNKVKEIVSKDAGYALIDRRELYLVSSGSVPKNKGGKYLTNVHKYPYAWFNTVLDYVNLDTSYNPYISKEGIYLAFNPEADFNTAYDEVVNHILDVLDQFWQKGVILANDIADTNTNKDILTLKWGLESIDKREVKSRLWKPVWSDNRFAKPMPDFLRRVVAGDNTIYISVSDNLVRRHYISKLLSNKGIEFKFVGAKLEAIADGYQIAQEIASIVDAATNLAEGKIIVYGADRPSWLQLFSDAALEYIDGMITDNITTYVTDNISKPYIISILLPNKTMDTTTTLQFLEDMVLERLIRLQKEYPNISPHSIVESTMTK